MSCADTLIAGNIIGKEALAAVGTVAPFMMLVTFFPVSYNGVFFDTTDCNATLTSFRQYIVSALMEVPDFKTYLVTTGYNRSVISFMV